MKTTFELWDVGSANIVGTFTSEDDVIEALTGLLDAHGSDYADELSLTRRQGGERAQVMLEGQQLIALTKMREVHQR